MIKRDKGSAHDDLFEAQNLCGKESEAVKDAIKTSSKNLMKMKESEFPASADPQSGDMFDF
jgi:hypothetical protein